MQKLTFSLCFFLSISAFANIRGSDLQNFNPNPNGLDFVTVHSSNTLTPLQTNFGGFINYTTNSLAYSTVSGAPNNQTFSEPNDRLLYSNLSIGMGLMDGWDFGIGAGFINAQDIEQSNFLFNYGDTGVNDVMVTTKLRLVNEREFGFAFVVGADFEQVKNNPFAGDDAGPSFNFEGVMDFQLTPELLWAINIGYRLRQEGTPIPNTGVTPMSDQFIYSTALSYMTSSKGSALIGELYGSYPVDEFTLPTDRQISNLEVLLSYRWRATKAFDFHGGVGTEAYQGLGSPDIRAFVGFNLRFDFLQNSNENGYSTEPKRVFQPTTLPDKRENNGNDQDQDGVPDPIDQCPNTWAQNYVDERGCPRKKNLDIETDYPE